MDKVQEEFPAPTGYRAWSYPFAPPQRYSSNYDTYVSRGGIVNFDNLAKKYASHQSITDPARFFFFCHLFDQIQKENLAGDFVEIGVYKGDTAVILADVARLLDRTAYLMDTYEGFDTKDFAGIDEGRALDFVDTSLESVRSRVGEQNTRYIKGYFPETAVHLPEDGRYALVHLDCDLYKPIINGLEYFYPRMVPGGFLVIHDYSSFGWDGAEKAVDTFFAGRPECVVPIPDSAGSVVVRKARAASGVDNWRVQKKVVHPGDWITAAGRTFTMLLDDGWSGIEDWGLWGVGGVHNLSFVIGGEPGPAGYDLDMDTHVALIGPRTHQSVDVTIDLVDNTTLSYTLDDNRGLRTIRLPDSLQKGDFVKVGLSPRFSESPAQLVSGNGETRRLGVALHRIRLRIR